MMNANHYPMRRLKATHLSPGRTQEGQSLIELALFFPVLLLIMTGMLDLGRVFSAYTIAVNATVSVLCNVTSLDANVVPRIITFCLLPAAASIGAKTTTCNIVTPSLITLTIASESPILKFWSFLN